MVTIPKSRRHVRAALLPPALLAAVAMLSGCSFPGSDRVAEPAASASPTAEVAISVLYSVTAESGSLLPVNGSASEFELTLSGADAHTIWFSDRPSHLAGTMATKDFVADWSDFGFADAPPNVAVVLHDGADESDTLVAELSSPSFDTVTSTLTATLTVLDEAAEANGKATFEHFTAQRDPVLPASFADVSIFINDVAGMVVDGCIVAPHERC